MDNVAGLLGANPYFSAGAGVLGITAAGGMFLKGAGRLAFYARQRLLVTIEIPIRDSIYPWFLEWMAKNSSHQSITSESNAKKSLLDRLFLYKFHQLSVETRLTQQENGSVSTEFSLVPGNGKHFFKYKNAWFQVERNRTSTMMNLSSGMPWETINITALSRDRDLFLLMLQEAKQQAQSKQKGKTVIYTAYGPEWRPFGNPRRKRPLDSVVLDKDITQDVLIDVEKFLSSSKWYNDRGIPYRRGYLFYGPPGSGKSSFIQSLAAELDYNICVLNLADHGMTDDRFAHLLNNLPPKSVILLEDIDAAFSDRSAETIKAIAKTNANSYMSSLTLSGLLNGLDGVVAAEERIVFMTTNYPERLDSALTRPGRIDYKVKLDNLTLDQASRMFQRFYSNTNHDEDQELIRFQERITQLGLVGKCSPASLQSHFIYYRNSSIQAVDNLAALSP